MTENTNRQPETVNIKILTIKNLRGLKKDIYTTVKVEFRDKNLGESPKTECIYDQVTVYNYNVSFQFSFDDFNLLDEISYQPVVLTIIEILPKEKKQKEEKSQILGQCSFDLLPLLRGCKNFSHSLIINPVSGSPLEQYSAELPLPTIDVEISCENPLIPEDKMSANNIISVVMESLYSPPDSFNSNTAGGIFTSALSLPMTNEKENLFVFSPGVVKLPGDKDFQSRQIRWVNPGQATNKSVYMHNSYISNNDYDLEDGDLRDKASRNHRIVSEKEKARVLWNMERRSVLQPLSMKLLKARIAKYRKWPIEIFRIGASSNKGRKQSVVYQHHVSLVSDIQKKGQKYKLDEENMVNFHGYAFVNLSPLLFPGVKRIRGAYKVIAYNEAECFEATGRNAPILDDAVRITNYLLNQQTSYLSSKKNVEKKSDKKPNTAKPALIPSSSMAQVPIQDQNSSEVPEMITNVDGHQYEEFESYITLEIKLDRPLIEKRNAEEVSEKIASYIPLRNQLSKKTNNADKVVEDYHSQVANITKQLLSEFRTIFSDELTNSEILNNQETMEQIRQELIYELNTTGKYFAFKEQLKYSIIKIVREKYLRTSTIIDQADLQEFLGTLFVYLVDELQEGIQKVITLKDTKPKPNIEISSGQLLHFAREAEINEDHIWADRYYKQRIAKDKNNPEFWFDYGIYLMAHRSLLDSEYCFKECISLSPQNLNGLIMYGIVSSLQNRLEEAETFFEAATIYYPTNVFAWTCLALFYISVDKDIQYDMAIQEANKLDSPRKSKSKSKPEIGEYSGPSLNQSEIMNDLTMRYDNNVITTTTGRSNDASEGSNLLLNVSQDCQGNEKTDSKLAIDGDLIDFKNDYSNFNRKESVQSDQKLLSNKVNILTTRKFSQLLKVTNSAASKHRSSSKDSDSKLDNESEITLNNKEISRSVFLKASKILFEFKAYSYVEKALAQELIYQNQVKNIVTQDQFNTLRAEYHLILAKTQLSLCLYEEAEMNLLETVQIAYDNADAWAYFGHLKFIVGDEQAAESCFTRALSLMDDIPEPHPVYMRLASLYLIQEKFSESKQTFLLACKKSPTCLSWLGVGISCYRLDDLGESEEALTEANLTNNENSEVWGYLSLICLKTSRKVEAEQSYKYALKVGLAEQSKSLLDEILDLQNKVGFGNPEI